MPTRMLEGTVLRPNGKPWEGGIVRVALVTAFATDDNTHEKDGFPYTCGASGEFVAPLVVPDTGTAAYTITLPNGTSYTAHIAVGVGNVRLEEIVANGTTPVDMDTTATVVDARLAPAFAPLTDGATITWDFAGAPLQNRTLTLGGNRTLSITNIESGAAGVLIVTQDGTGSRTLALPAGSKVIDGGAGVIPLSTVGGKVDVLSFVYNGTHFFWTYGKNFTAA